jgi:hypothetical protein
MANTLPEVGDRYGAPMGRNTSGFELAPDVPLNLHRVYLDAGGYDSGGAYWGRGAPIYTYGNGAGWHYLRAADRDAAKAIVRERHGDVRFLR